MKTRYFVRYSDDVLRVYHKDEVNNTSFILGPDGTQNGVQSDMELSEIFPQLYSEITKTLFDAYLAWGQVLPVRKKTKPVHKGREVYFEDFTNLLFIKLHQGDKVIEGKDFFTATKNIDGTSISGLVPAHRNDTIRDEQFITYFRKI